MASRDDVERVRRVIIASQKVKERRVEVEAVEKRRTETEEGSRHEAEVRANEARLRATGIVDLFNALRDSRTVVLTEKEPAVVRFCNDDHSMLAIEFDKHMETSKSFGSDWDGVVTYHTRCVLARFDKDGGLWVDAIKVKDDLVGAVGMAISR